MDTRFPKPLPNTLLPRESFAKRWVRRGLLRMLGFFRPYRFPAPHIARILVIRPDHIGDVLLITPALRLLRQTFPEAEITALVGPWSEVVLAENPHLDRIEVCRFPGFDRSQPRQGACERMCCFGKKPHDCAGKNTSLPSTCVRTSGGARRWPRLPAFPTCGASRCRSARRFSPTRCRSSTTSTRRPPTSAWRTMLQPLAAPLRMLQHPPAVRLHPRRRASG